MSRLYDVADSRWARRLGGTVLILALLAELSLFAKPSLLESNSAGSVSTGNDAPLAATGPESATPTTAAQASAGGDPTTSTSTPPTTTAAPTTTVPVLPAPVKTAGRVAYTVPAGQTVTITASQPCWIEARTSATGSVLVEKILAAGDVQTLQTPLWIRFGSPTSVAVTLGTQSLELPSLSGELVLQAA